MCAAFSAELGRAARNLRRIAEFTAFFRTLRSQIRYNASLTSNDREGATLMTDAERQIMRYFKQYRIGANEMLFFNANVANSGSSKFTTAMESLIRNGLVIRERRRNAYSLTIDGFAASQSA